jgi:hypothetical protein
MELLVLLGSLIESVSFVTYILSINKGEAKPNLVTWILWAAAPILAAFFALSAGVNWIIIVPTLMSGLGPMIIVIAALIKKGAVWKITGFDYVCGISSLGCLILWLLTGNSDLGIALAIFSDFLAALPTILKAWKHPESESYTIFLINIFTKFTVFFVAKTWSFAELGFTIYLIGMNFVITAVIYGRGRILSNKRRH